MNARELAPGRREFGRLGWSVAELGYGMWGLADWSGSDPAKIEEALQRAVDLGVNYFDTAWAYGGGRSERALGALLRENHGTRLRVATKVPPMNWQWPSQRGQALSATFPPEHIRAYCEKSLENLGVDQIDLLQFHVWEDDWAEESAWQSTVEALRSERLIGGVGISVNRWEPTNVLRTLRTGLVDSVQVIYNIFDQEPEDALFPLCRELGVAVIARVPFDEGTLTGSLTLDSTWAESDFRHQYFGPENLAPSVKRAKVLEAELPPGMTLAELALRFIISNPDVTTTIPGMRRVEHVSANAAAVAAGPLTDEMLARLRRHRWSRCPAPWAQ
jgi:aryl-alcohol dehydrogenase-like predicted oxidoreductase